MVFGRKWLGLSTVFSVLTAMGILSDKLGKRTVDMSHSPEYKESQVLLCVSMCV